jgi:hypothetical protein
MERMTHIIPRDRVREREGYKVHPRTVGRQPSITSPSPPLVLNGCPPLFTGALRGGVPPSRARAHAHTHTETKRYIHTERDTCTYRERDIFRERETWRARERAPTLDCCFIAPQLRVRCHPGTPSLCSRARCLLCQTHIGPTKQLTSCWTPPTYKCITAATARSATTTASAAAHAVVLTHTERDRENHTHTLRYRDQSKSERDSEIEIEIDSERHSERERERERQREI